MHRVVDILDDRRIFFFVGLLILLTPGAPFAHQSGNVITWPYFSYPPYVVIGEDGELSGITVEIRRLLWEAMPEYEHKTMEAPFARSYMLAKDGMRLCFTGLLRTAEREQFLTYSIPIFVSGPSVLITRKGALDQHKKDGHVLLDEVLEDEALTLGLINQFSHGKYLDSLLTPRMEEKNVFVIKDMKTLSKQFDLLRAGRIDYFIFPNVRAAYFAGKDSADLEFLSIAGEEDPFFNYVACTKGAWGEAVIERINGVLVEAIPTEEYLGLSMEWVEEDLRPGLRKNFEELLIPEARSYEP